MCTQFHFWFSTTQAPEIAYAYIINTENLEIVKINQYNMNPGLAAELENSQENRTGSLLDNHSI